LKLLLARKEANPKIADKQSCSTLPAEKMLAPKYSIMPGYWQRVKAEEPDSADEESAGEGYRGGDDLSVKEDEDVTMDDIGDEQDTGSPESDMTLQPEDLRVDESWEVEPFASAGSANAPKGRKGKGIATQGPSSDTMSANSGLLGNKEELKVLKHLWFKLYNKIPEAGLRGCWTIPIFTWDTYVDPLPTAYDARGVQN